MTSARPLDAARHLDAFSRLCRASREYQGHGWGCAIWRGGEWETYRTTRPIWEDRYRPSGEVRTFVAHARSAFRDEGIEVENNMPFVSGERAFVFNGELRGVRLAMEGRTGAEKLFRYIDRRRESPLSHSIARGMTLVRKRTARIRACNFILAEPGWFHLHTLFDGEEDYFTMWLRRSPGEFILCSEPYPRESVEQGDPCIAQGEVQGIESTPKAAWSPSIADQWMPVPNDCHRSFPWSS